MRNLGFVLLAVSILLGLIAIIGVRQVSGARANSAPHAPMTSVIVAARPIGFGEAIGPQALRVQPWPAGAQPPGSFRTVEQITTGQTRVAMGPIAANEPILASRISGPGGRATLSGVLRPKMRAAAIRVNDVVGVAGFVLPGDFVDVLLTRNDGQKSEQAMRTDVLIRGVRVLAVDQLANENKNDPVVAKAVTVEVTPEQAQQLALATEVGSLSLALRGTVDPFASPEPAQTVRVSDLRLAGAPPAKPHTLPPRRPMRRSHAGPARTSIEVFRGVQSVQVAPAAERNG